MTVFRLNIGFLQDIIRSVYLFIGSFYFSYSLFFASNESINECICIKNEYSEVKYDLEVKMCAKFMHKIQKA